jgi:hypothetical protein
MQHIRKRFQEFGSYLAVMLEARQQVTHSHQLSRMPFSLFSYRLVAAQMGRQNDRGEKN